MGLAYTAVDHFAESASTLTDGVPVLGNPAICQKLYLGVLFLCITTGFYAFG